MEIMKGGCTAFLANTVKIGLRKKYIAHSILRFKRRPLYEKLSNFYELLESVFKVSSRQHQDDEPPPHTHIRKKSSSGG